MQVINELLALLRRADGLISDLRVSRIYLPAAVRAPDRDADFAWLALTDGSVGLFYAWLGRTEEDLRRLVPDRVIVGASAMAVAELAQDPDSALRALGCGAINALSQAVFRAAGWQPARARDSVTELELKRHDRVGMVGYFPSLARRLQGQGVSLLVLEQRPELLAAEPELAVTTDVGELTACNKILCTGSVILNNTVDQVLRCCANADRLIMVGPTAGCLPDPLFARGCDVVGGVQVRDPSLLATRMRCGESWEQAVGKYRIDRADYPGFASLATVGLANSARS